MPHDVKVSSIEPVKRQRSFFEPLFDPNDYERFPEDNWDFATLKSRAHKTLTAAGFVATFAKKQKIVIGAVCFDRCDFHGDYKQYTPSFKECVFERCDFGLSKWHRTRFKNCYFYRCSFTLAEMINCEFRDCSFVDVGISGNETILSGTLFTNPKVFVDAAFANLDAQFLQKYTQKSSAYQKMRLEGTKAVVARTIMSSLATAGDEQTYYQAVALYQDVSITARITAAKFDLSQKPGLDDAVRIGARLMISYFDKALVISAGRINNWGASIARPALSGVSIMIIYTLIYYLGSVRPTFFKSFVTGAEITLLVGYTKHATIGDFSRIQLLFFSNMILGLIWYSIFVATVVGRITRIR